MSTVYSIIMMITIIVFLITFVKVLLISVNDYLADVISTSRFMIIVVRSVKNCFWKESHVTVFLRGRRNHHTLS